MEGFFLASTAKESGNLIYLGGVRERERKGGNYRDNQSIVALIGKGPRERRRESSPKPRLTTSLPFAVALSGGQTDSEVEEEEEEEEEEE